MSKKLNSEIILIVDKSGSMGHLTDDTIGGFNKFLKDQKAEPGKATATLVLFNHNVDTLYEGVPLSDIEPLTRKTYVPGGTTALLAAVGSTVKNARKRHKKGKRPDKTVVCIITDGHENSSDPEKWSKATVAGLLERSQEKLSWDVFFLGADIDVFAEAGGMGIQATAAMGYDATQQGTKAAYSLVGQTVSTARGTKSRTNTDEDWKTPDPSTTAVKS